MKYLIPFTLFLSLAAAAGQDKLPAKSSVAATAGKNENAPAPGKHKPVKKKKLASEGAPGEEPELTDEEKALAEAGERIIYEEQHRKGGKPIPKALLDKMNSTFPEAH